jgi:hypothetical protein
MLHACVERFDVMGERGNILDWDGEVNPHPVIPPQKGKQIFFSFSINKRKKGME